MSATRSLGTTHRIVRAILDCHQDRTGLLIFGLSRFRLAWAETLGARPAQDPILVHCWSTVGWLGDPGSALGCGWGATTYDWQVLTSMRFGRWLAALPIRTDSSPDLSSALIFSGSTGTANLN